MTATTKLVSLLFSLSALCLLVHLLYFSCLVPIFVRFEIYPLSINLTQALVPASFGSLLVGFAAFLTQESYKRRKVLNIASLGIAISSLTLVLDSAFILWLYVTDNTAKSYMSNSLVSWISGIAIGIGILVFVTNLYWLLQSSKSRTFSAFTYVKLFLGVLGIIAYLSLTNQFEAGVLLMVFWAWYIYDIRILARA